MLDAYCKVIQNANTDLKKTGHDLFSDLPKVVDQDNVNTLPAGSGTDDPPQIVAGHA